MIVFGQTKEKRHRGGIKAGTEFGFLIQDNPNSKASSTSVGLGYFVMVDFIDYRITDKWSTTIGLGYAYKQFIQQTNRVRIIDLMADSDEVVNLSNIEFPITLNYTFKKRSKYNCIFAFGGIVHYYVSQNSRADLQLNDGSSIEYPIDFTLPRTTYSSVANINIEIFTKKRFSWIIEPSIKYNFLSLDFEYGNSTKALLSIGIAGGIKF